MKQEKKTVPGYRSPQPPEGENIPLSKNLQRNLEYLRAAGHNTADLFLYRNLQYRLQVLGADLIENVGSVLTGVIREIVTQNGLIAQPSGCFNGNHLLGGPAQKQNLFHRKTFLVLSFIDTIIASF